MNDSDYVFLSRIPYRSVGEVTETELDQWFGAGMAVERDDVVEQYRSDNKVVSAVSFKLVTIDSADDNDPRPYAFVLIRGTKTRWDLLANVQIWMPAVLFQVLRTLIPFGHMWTPVGDELIRLLSGFESDSVDKVNFYRHTSGFVQFLKSQPEQYRGVVVNGHSLGGGLSLITAAQTQVQAVALSGINTMLTRKAVDPIVSADDVNRYTFNIIPEGDVIPMIDDRARSFQEIRCKTEHTDYLSCHDFHRSLCEVMYSCGSQGRPVACECVYRYGYPEPMATDNLTLSFAQACGVAEDQ